MLIKTTPPELAVPSYNIEWHSEAFILAKTTPNPGVPDNVFLSLAKKVVRDLPEFDTVKWRSHLIYLAEKHAAKTSTDNVVSDTQEATHNVIDGVHMFTNYEDPEKPDYFPGA